MLSPAFIDPQMAAGDQVSRSNAQGANVKVTEDQVLEIVQKHSLSPDKKITRDTRIEDAGVDSYSLIEVVFELEEELDIEIPYNANESKFGEAETVGDLLDELMALLKKA